MSFKPANNLKALTIQNPDVNISEEKFTQNLIADLPKNPYKIGDYYNATAYFKCSVGDTNHGQQCPGGIVRRGNGNASVVVLYPNGYEVQYDFKNGNVTSTYNGDLNWGKSDDEWYIGIDNKLFIIIPDAAVYGG
ncbi:hypothetical protein [Cyanobacterium sp. Dongsha4]|uniref:hypothetical protein n=1 Tax=Cyanobacterium sp. DS4 TaxID=2878255 RepID=UPI002E81F93A|nr:hypothetical protein [Cyanobacterium sp. Dongsha4]WVK99719.1 hypothetical protein Dongsha4_13700 [Cyanobacterium sp. Dongsha4]